MMRLHAFLLCFFLSSSLPGQQAGVPEIPYHSVPGFLKLPPDAYLGEAAGGAVNSKGHVFVFSRGDASAPAYGAAAARLLECAAAGKVVREMGHGHDAWS